jgi:preprotein translocase subunit SecG
MTTTILIIINVFAALSIIVLALMQQSKGDMGSAFGGGGSQSMFGSRGSANFLSRLTATMCAAFFISSLALAYVYAKRAEATSVVDNQSSLITPAVESELPTIEAEAVETDASGDIPAIEGLQEASSDAIEAIETQIPVVPDSTN